MVPAIENVCFNETRNIPSAAGDILWALARFHNGSVDCNDPTNAGLWSNRARNLAVAATVSATFTLELFGLRALGGVDQHSGNLTGS
jgi:hypothetical protein